MGGAYGRGAGPRARVPRKPRPRGGARKAGRPRSGGGGQTPTVSRGTCAGSPGRRASGTGQSPEVWPVRARPPAQRPGLPRSRGPEPEPPSSAAARVAEARAGRVEPERELEPEDSARAEPRRRGRRGGPRPFIARERPPAPCSPRGGRSGTRGHGGAHVPGG